MSILQTVTTGRTAGGLRIVLAGAEKMGKTTLLGGAPDILVVPLEEGTGGIDVAKTAKLTTFDQAMMALDELIAVLNQCYQTGEPFPYRNLAFDTVTKLESYIHTEIIQREVDAKNGNAKGVTMETALGGYGRGYLNANEKFQNFLTKCDYLAIYGKVNIILTCHVFASLMADPTAGDYYTWDLLLHSPKNAKTYGKREILTQWADIIGFIYEPYVVSSSQDGSNRAVSANQGRKMGLERHPNYVAGNRLGMTGEISISKENGWNDFSTAVWNSTDGLYDLFKR